MDIDRGRAMADDPVKIGVEAESALLREKAGLMCEGVPGAAAWLLAAAPWRTETLEGRRARA